jgi:hypothetical protein
VVVFLLTGIALGTAGLAYLAGTLLDDLYAGVPSSIAVLAPNTACTSVAAARCDTISIRLNAGRYHVRTRQPASDLTVTTLASAPDAQPRFVLIRSRRPGRLTIGSTSFDVTEANVRSVVRIPDDRFSWTNVRFEQEDARQPIIIDEIGFFRSDVGLLRPQYQPLQRISARSFYNTVAVLWGLGVAALLVLAAFVAPRVVTTTGPWLLTILCLSVCLIEVETNLSPYWKYDARAFYASETVESGHDGNLTGGLFVGARAYSDQGLTVGPGEVEWHRMPGYGLFCAVAAALAGTTDVVQFVAIVILLQVALYAVAVAVFVAVAPRVFSVGIAYLLGVLLMLLPKQLHYTQSDSLIAPIAILVSAALMVYLAETVERPRPRMSTFLLVNGAFALWFVMRNDVLPGWLIVTAYIARHRLRWMAVPACLIALITVSWAAYKQPYRHEFDAMPTNTGEVLYLSLCDVPSRLPYACDDLGYATWIQRTTGDADFISQRASTRAVAEVVKYWFTYPMHFVLMTTTKFDRALHDQFWSGVFTRFNAIYAVMRDYDVTAWLLAVMIIAIAVGHERRRSLLLGWPLFLSMPIYFVVWTSGGRFYPPANVAAIVAAVPLLADREFLRKIVSCRSRAAAAFVCVVVVLVVLKPIEMAILEHDAVHYWAPLLDPRGSSLVVR